MTIEEKAAAWDWLVKNTRKWSCNPDLGLLKGPDGNHICYSVTFVFDGCSYTGRHFDNVVQLAMKDDKLVRGN